jgi:hypothetical protein
LKQIEDMKKISLILLFAMGLFLASCGGEEAETTEVENTEEVADNDEHTCDKDGDKKCCNGEKKCDKDADKKCCDGDKKCEKDSTAEGSCEEGSCMEGACGGGEAHDNVDEVIEEITE